jgi:hypothetical protein
MESEKNEFPKVIAKVRGGVLSEWSIVNCVETRPEMQEPRFYSC